jgi:hypothetical protein
MKKAIIFLSVILLATITFVLISFKPKNVHSKYFTTVTYYYTGCYQRIEPGHNIGPCCQKSLNQSFFTDVFNWTTAATSCSVGSLYICSITFDEEATADGGNDGQLTLREALDAVWATYVAPTPDDLPATVYVATGAGSTPAAKVNKNYGPSMLYYL